MRLQAHAAEIALGDTVAYETNGERKEIAARNLLRDCGCVHVYDYGRRVTFALLYPVEIVR